MTPLKARLVEQIEKSGPIPLSDYMRICLADPQDGYYTRHMPLGAAGDFTTSPEISQVFGELIGLWCADLWVRAGMTKPFSLVELGPGRGTLMADALRSTYRVPGFLEATTVHFVEINQVLEEEQARRVPQAQWHSHLDSLEHEGPALFIANEFFDALPVQQIVKTQRGWQEQCVDSDGNKLFPVVPKAGLLLNHLVPPSLQSAPQGAIYELGGGRQEIRIMGDHIRNYGGGLLIIDYGYMDHALGDTFQALKNHSYVDPFDTPGEADLTTHVNFAQLADWCGTNLRISGPITQGTFLRRLGLDVRTAMLAKANPERAEELLGASRRLTDPDQMGNLFKVMAISHPDWPAPGGF